MTIQLRPIDQLASKYATRAQAAAPEYKAGVSNPKKDWAADTVAGKDAWTQGLAEAQGNGAFQRGVVKAGNGKWQAKSTEVGAGRYGPGVAAAKSDWATGFTPFAGVLSSLSLPTKGSRGSGQNIERVRAVADALHAKRVSGGG